MEYYNQFNTGKSDAIIKEHQEVIDKMSNKVEIENYLLTLAAKISEQNVNKDGKETLSFNNIEGGPFGAVITREENERIVIIGIGANHVVPCNDPSAHAEMSAIRDASKRISSSDLSNASIYSSCECCPQCLSSSIAAGISKIIYANDRFQADKIGFSDEEQYRYMKDIFKSMQKASTDDEKLLANYDAIIIDKEGNIIASANSNPNETDPMQTLASMQVIREACAKTKHFFLPEGVKLITRKIPHPASFITADWARIGRVRDTHNPEDPTKDKFDKDASKILYVENEFEEIILHDKKIAQHSEEIIKIYEHDVHKNNINVKIARTDNNEVLKEAEKAFDIWSKLTQSVTEVKY